MYLQSTASRRPNFLPANLTTFQSSCRIATILQSFLDLGPLPLHRSRPGRNRSIPHARFHGYLDCSLSYRMQRIHEFCAILHSAAARLHIRSREAGGVGCGDRLMEHKLPLCLKQNCLFKQKPRHTGFHMSGISHNRHLQN